MSVSVYLSTKHYISKDMKTLQLIFCIRFILVKTQVRSQAVALGRLFFEYLDFFLSVSFHETSIVTFNSLTIDVT
jgi:hypothetical protein